MQFRWAATVIAASACAACANDTTAPAQFTTSPMHLMSPAAAAEAKLPELRKTHASRVLSAIALEKVTGRKPDPARLMELD